MDKPQHLNDVDNSLLRMNANISCGHILLSGNADAVILKNMKTKSSVSQIKTGTFIKWIRNNTLYVMRIILSSLLNAERSKKTKVRYVLTTALQIPNVNKAVNAQENAHANHHLYGISLNLRSVKRVPHLMTMQFNACLIINFWRTYLDKNLKRSLRNQVIISKSTR